MKSQKAEKVDLQEFIDSLCSLWERGVDYIDIIINEDEKKITIDVKKEYMSEEAIEEDEEDDFTDISDLNINDII